MKDKKSNGATIGLIVVLLILIVGGFYIWRSQLKEPTEPEVFTPITTEDEAELNDFLEDLGTTDGEARFEIENVE